METRSIGTVVTIASGPDVYRKLAINLARSFCHWNEDSDLAFIICTDRLFPLPSDISSVKLLYYNPSECGSHFSPKLYLDKILPPGPTLFVDGDCLVLGLLTPIFEKYRGQSFVIPGDVAEVGNFYTDIAALLKRTGLPWMPSLVTSVYFWTNTAQESPVFATARSYESRYDDLNLWRLRGQCSDEPLLAIGMATNGIRPIEDDGWLKADCHQFSAPPSINVQRGIARFHHHTPTIPRPNLPLIEEARPLIVHFNATYAFQSPYTREAAVLRWTRSQRWPVKPARIVAYLRYTLPQQIEGWAKNLLRPLFRQLFGYRRILKDPRSV